MSQKYEYILSDRPEVAEFLPKLYKTVLEIGCAKGGFKASLISAAEVWGIEPNALAACEASSRGYRVIEGLYDEVSEQCPDDYFDLIICNDVIEHMIDHESFLLDIKRKMKKDGHLVGSVPNVRYFGNLFKLLIKKDWMYENQGVLDRTHLRFFTEKSLRNTFLWNGYVIEKLNGINSDFSRLGTAKQIVRNAVLMLITLITFGYFSDIQYIQYGFRLKLEN